MDFLNKFKTATARRPKQQLQNRAVKIKSYNLSSAKNEEHTVVGTDLLNNIEVEISLAVQSVALESGHSRLELAQIANPQSGKVHVSVGGVLIFENCREIGVNRFVSDWANAAIHRPELTSESIEMGYSTVVLHPARIDARNPSKNVFNTAFVRTVKTKEAKAFSCAETTELFQFLGLTLNPKVGQGGYRPEAIVRFVDRSNQELGEAVGSIILTAPTVKQDLPNGDTHYVVCDAQTTMREIFSSPTDNTPKAYTGFQMIFEEMKNNPSMPKESFFVEVIPVVRRNFGSEKKKAFFGLVDKPTSNGVIKINARTPIGNVLFNRFHKPSDENNVTKLWLPAVTSDLCAFDTVIEGGIEVRKPKDYRFIKDIFTKDAFPKGFEQDYIPTDNYTNKAFMVERYTKTNHEVKAVPSVSEPLTDESTLNQQPPQEDSSTEQSKQTAKPVENQTQHASIGDIEDAELFGELEKILNTAA
ncbi:conserved hypothetical protein [Vibrio chagasii]|nr:conserved hypothetical protein [Vibrio chagasii]CAH6947639.1 conserved hypothetical protein [Vibrio chagasii]